jgi:hypothetical protein
VAHHVPRICRYQPIAAVGYEHLPSSALNVGAVIPETNFKFAVLKILKNVLRRVFCNVL